MAYARFLETLGKFGSSIIERSRLIALGLVVGLTFIAMQPAEAQTSDTWKSVAIIGGSTAAGAYIGNKVGGKTGALVGAGVGASAGYAIDRRRRTNQYNDRYAYNDGGYYGNQDAYYGNGGYSGNDGGYYGNDGYYGPYGNGPYPSGFRSNYTNTNQCWSRR